MRVSRRAAQTKVCGSEVVRWVHACWEAFRMFVWWCLVGQFHLRLNLDLILAMLDHATVELSEVPDHASADALVHFELGRLHEQEDERVLVNCIEGIDSVLAR